jgi:hypothetical protein
MSVQKIGASATGAHGFAVEQQQDFFGPHGVILTALSSTTSPPIPPWSARCRRDGALGRDDRDLFVFTEEVRLHALDLMIFGDAVEAVRKKGGERPDDHGDDQV